MTIHTIARVGSLPVAQSYLRTTLQNGSYSLTGLAAGSYTICAVLPGTDLMDPCQWGDLPHVVQVPASGGVKDTLQLLQGATISIHVSDPGMALAVAPPGTSGTRLLMGVWTNRGHFHNAPKVSSNSNSHDYTLIIAPDVDLQLTVNSAGLKVVDSSSNAVNNSQKRAVRLSAGQKQQFLFTVTKTP